MINDPVHAQATIGPSAGETASRVKISGPLRRLLVWQVPANLGLYLLWGAIPTVLLPIQVAGIDPANKVANLAVVTTSGAFAAMVAQPMAGAISDRTRSRFGRRAPWLVAGSLVGGLWSPRCAPVSTSRCLPATGGTTAIWSTLCGRDASRPRKSRGRPNA